MNDDQIRLLTLFDALPPDVQPVALDALQHLEQRDRIAGPFGWLMGYQYTRREPGACECELEISPSHLNPGKIAHGGVVYTLADAAMGAAVMAMLDGGQRCVTAELKVNYLRAVAAGKLTARAKVVRKGRRLATVTADVVDKSGEAIAIALGTFAIVSGPSGPASGK